MLSTRVESIQRDIDVFLRQELSPAARSRTLATFAREKLAEAQTQNARALGRTPPHKTFVDRVEGVPEERVNPDRGTILYQFELVADALGYIHGLLEQHSPARSGAYRRAHELFADGAIVDDPARPPPAAEYVFLNTQPYARKIERGLSPQAPDGVYEVVAALARRRFGNVARISYSFRAPVGAGLSALSADRDNRQPAIIVSLR